MRKKNLTKRRRLAEKKRVKFRRFVNVMYRYGMEPAIWKYYHPDTHADTQAMYKKLKVWYLGDMRR